MWNVGDYVVLKPDLKINQKYGTVRYSTYHADFQGRLLRIIKISSTGTFYLWETLNYNTCRTTFHEDMLICAKYHIGETFAFMTLDEHGGLDPIITDIKEIKYAYTKKTFLYRIKKQSNMVWVEEKDILDVSQCVSTSITNISTNLNKLNNENQLQRKDSHISNGEGVKGSGVHGGYSKASVRSRPLRNASRIRGK